MSDTPEGLELVSLTPDTWTMFEAMVVRRNGIFCGCWCIWFHPDSDERGQGAAANRALKKRYVEQCAARAALVVDDGVAMAWAEYGTPAELPNIHHRKQYDAEAESCPSIGSPASWSTTVPSARPGRDRAPGSGRLDLPRRRRGRRGYPHVPVEKKVSSSFLYNGTRAMYERCGFDSCGPRG